MKSASSELDALIAGAAGACLPPPLIMAYEPPNNVPRTPIASYNTRNVSHCPPTCRNGALFGASRESGNGRCCN